MEIDSSNLNDSDREAESTTSDLRDIEFQLMHNLNDLQVFNANFYFISISIKSFIFLKNKTLNCQKFTFRELNLLKIILTCGILLINFF